MARAARVAVMVVLIGAPGWAMAGSQDVSWGMAGAVLAAAPGENAEASGLMASAGWIAAGAALGLRRRQRR